MDFIRSIEPSLIRDLTWIPGLQNECSNPWSNGTPVVDPQNHENLHNAIKDHIFTFSHSQKCCIALIILEFNGFTFPPHYLNG